LTGNGHSLQPVRRQQRRAVLDPGLAKARRSGTTHCPAHLPANLRWKATTARRLGRLANVIGTGVLILGLILAWRFTPLSALAHPDSIRQWLVDIAEIPAAPLIVLATFVLGGLVVFPVMLLIAATGAAFGPWLGFALAGVGAIASAVITYGIGAAMACSRSRRSAWSQSHRLRWLI
jgi:hypothetical protein